MPRRTKPEAEAVEPPAVTGTGRPEPPADGKGRAPSRPSEPAPVEPSGDSDQVWRRPLKR